MKQSFEVFEQSDGVALHLTVTVDSDAFQRPTARATIAKLAHASTATGDKARTSCRSLLKQIALNLSDVVQNETTAYTIAEAQRCEQNGHRARQDEVDNLNATIELLTADLAAAKTAAKKPRATRKAARK